MSNRKQQVTRIDAFDWSGESVQLTELRTLERKSTDGAWLTTSFAYYGRANEQLSVDVDGWLTSLQTGARYRLK